MTIFTLIGLTGLKAAGTLIATDFASGIIHWLEDSYGKPNWPFFGKHVIQPNIEHHFHPRKFTKTNLWSRNIGTLTISLTLGIIILLCGWWSIWWGLALFIGAFANEIHCWAHRSPKENGKLITAFQKLGLLQSARHHGKHHTDPKNRTYCTITNYLNPLLDHFRVFQKAETLIEKTTGISRRVDESVKVPRQKRCSGKCAACTCSPLKTVATPKD